MKLFLLIALLTCFNLAPAASFLHQQQRSRGRRTWLQARKKDEHETPKTGPSSSVDTPGWKLASEFSAHIGRLHLEEQWKQDFLKSGPRFLSYSRCKSWVQAQNMWESQEEWEDWISMGEKNNSLIPSDPERHYKERGTWVSWDDFFGV